MGVGRFYVGAFLACFEEILGRTSILTEAPSSYFPPLIIEADSSMNGTFPFGGFTHRKRAHTLHSGSNYSCSALEHPFKKTHKNTTVGTATTERMAMKSHVIHNMNYFIERASFHLATLPFSFVKHLEKRQSSVCF